MLHDGNPTRLLIDACANVLQDGQSGRILRLWVSTVVQQQMHHFRMPKCCGPVERSPVAPAIMRIHLRTGFQQQSRYFPLLVLGAWWGWRTWYSADQIRAAIRDNDADRVSLLIKLGAPVDVDVEFIPPASDEQFKCKPLHWTVIYNHLAIAELLLANGAEVDAKDTDTYRETPLHWAASYESSAAAAFLLANGADPNAKARGGTTPLHLWPKLAEIVKQVAAEKAGKKQPAKPKVATP